MLICTAYHHTPPLISFCFLPMLHDTNSIIAQKSVAIQYIIYIAGKNLAHYIVTLIRKLATLIL